MIHKIGTVALLIAALALLVILGSGYVWLISRLIDLWQEGARLPVIAGGALLVMVPSTVVAMFLLDSN